MDNFKIIDKKEKKHILEDVRFYFDIFVMQQILLDGAEETLHHEHVEVFEKKTSPKVIVETKKMTPSCETTVESSKDKRLKI
ncbi:MAG: hypothetical protein K6E76_02170 [Patescibacteria group bacterium]|nr:hypothetical protein [Patescibacteria group bacterium]